MLHDPKWNHGTLDGLITWLEGKPRDATYIYADGANCLICQYIGNSEVPNWTEEMRRIYGGCDSYKIARGHSARSGDPQTYGSALERAYEARAALIAA